MDNRRNLWNKAGILLLKLNDVKFPMQNNVEFTEEEILEFATINFGLCNDLESLITDIQKYMKEK